jgi:GTP pyrophosphokinase
VRARFAASLTGKKVRFEDLLDRFREARSEADLELLRRAWKYATEAHEGQVRRSGEPYVQHPLAVALILSDLHLDATSVAVALLHDVIEDTGATREELSAEFGEEVAKLVEGVTKIGNLEFTSKLEQQAVNFRKLLLAMVDDVRVLLVKLADRLHNMRTLGPLKPDKQARIAAETLEIYAPLAHRLGMGRMQSELEDLSFKYLEPAEYKRLNGIVQGRLKAARRLTARLQREIETAMSQQEIPCRVSHRVKGLNSLHRKMQSRDLDIEQVYDLVAFRIITDTVRSCYAALGAIHNRWSPMPGRFKDFVAMPKRNMYQSLHTTMIEAGRPFEVQIRTEEMHRVAEEGIAAHWIYKEGDDVAEEAQPLAWLRQLVEYQHDVSDPGEFLSSLKLNLYPDEVYVFTPKGEVRSLRRGSTAIDFGYMIHTEVGQHCSGARINGKLSPLRQELKNGDIVEVLTSPDASPSRDWLQMVKTSRARNRIRGYLNKQEREKSVDLGRKMLDRELRRFGLTLRKVDTDGALDRQANHLGLAAAEDLLVGVSFGKVALRPLVERLVPSDRLDSPKPLKRSRLRRMVDKAMGWGAEDAIRVKGIDDIMVYRARCCGPVPGEPIIGYVTRGKGVAVHAATCGNISRLLQTEDRRIDVVWRAAKGTAQPLRLWVEVDDSQGLLARLTSAIAEAGSNIRHIESRMKGYRGQIELVLEVRDRDHLRRIVGAVNSLDGVRNVRRGRTP